MYTLIYTDIAGTSEDRYTHKQLASCVDKFNRIMEGEYPGVTWVAWYADGIMQGHGIPREQQS